MKHRSLTRVRPNTFACDPITSKTFVARARKTSSSVCAYCICVIAVIAAVCALIDIYKNIGFKITFVSNQKRKTNVSENLVEIFEKLQLLNRSTRNNQLETSSKFLIRKNGNFKKLSKNNGIRTKSILTETSHLNTLKFFIACICM